MGITGDNTDKIEITENMNENLCEKIGGKALPLKSGGKVCVFPKDSNGNITDVDAENITPQMKEKIEEKTGEELR